MLGQRGLDPEPRGTRDAGEALVRDMGAGSETDMVEEGAALQRCPENPWLWTTTSGAPTAARTSVALPGRSVDHDGRQRKIVLGLAASPPRALRQAIRRRSGYPPSAAPVNPAATATACSAVAAAAAASARVSGRTLLTLAFCEWLGWRRERRSRQLLRRQRHRCLHRSR